MFLRALAECVHLHLALFDFDSDATKPPFACTITPLDRPTSFKQSRVKVALDDLFSPLPRMHRGYSRESVREQVQALEPDRFDAVFSYRIDFARFAGVERHPRLILDIDDPEHLRQADGLRVRLGRNIDWRTRLDLHKLRRFERDVVRSTKAAFVCQDRDADAFEPLRPLVVCNSVDVPDQVYRCESSTPTLLFVGNMIGGEQSPNGDAALWFLRSIWPTVLQHVPECQCRLAGRMSESLHSFIQDVPNVEAIGFVEAIAEAYANAWISVAPIRYGTGTRIKILEALAHACPVVSTPKGCEGIDAIDGSNILVGASEAAFAQACVNLLKDSNKRHRIGQAGRELIVERYNRYRQHDMLVDLLNRLLYE
jgi:glycosyltransferase involved in cell wall biosynthesis